MCRILVSAFACCPYKGSEEGVGWNWIESLSKHRDLVVITRSFNECGENTKKAIETYLLEKGISNIEFIFYDLPSVFHKMMHGIPIHLYYALWQKLIYKKIKQNINSLNVGVIHHVSYNEFRTSGDLWKLDKPFVWGPIGGGASYPKEFDYLLKNVIMFERFRKVYNSICCYSPKIRSAIKKASFVLVAEESTEKLLPKKYKHKYIRFTEVGVIEINGSLTNQNNLYIKEDRLKLLWVGRVIGLKGLPLLLEAMKLVNDNITLTVIGDGSELENSKKITEKLGISNKIIFKGNLMFSQVKEEYMKSDIFVFTSLRDATGTVILEAMSHGLPVICLNHHGAKEVIKEDMGFKINPITPDYVIKELATKINLLDQDRERLLKMKEAVLKEAAKYLWSERAKYINKMYISVLDTKKV